VSKLYRKALRKRKQRIARRLRLRQWPNQPQPMFRATNIHYEMSEKCRAMSYGGIGAIHAMVRKLGLVEQLDDGLPLLKRHLPYHESDHVLNIGYNVMLDGKRLGDIELRRQDEVFLDGLDAQRITDPTTSGDFTRRFREQDIGELMERINATRQRVWAQQPRGFLEQAFVDVDGTIAPTLGECKGGMALSYKGIWGYAPLVISLANTREGLYLLNRPGNVVSHDSCVPWMDRAIALTRRHAAKICLRGDTDFSLTAEFDRWAAEGVDFLFGMDAHPKLVAVAEALAQKDWMVLERVPRYEIATEPRRKRVRIKEGIVRQKGYRNRKLLGENVAEFRYRPLKCRRQYRVVALRKNLSVARGKRVLFDEICYFFYITTLEELTAEQVVGLVNERCDQENVIEQLKNGVNAMRMPVDDLLSNWAYMVMTALGWNLKAWLALLCPNRRRGAELLRMEFRRFLHAVMLVTAQVLRAGRRIVYRLLGWTPWVGELLRTWQRLRRICFT